MTTMMNTGPNYQLAGFGWGCNRDGWEFEIHNDTPVDLVPLYFGSSNIERVDTIIKAGEIGYAKGSTSSLPPFVFDGPAHADLAFRYGSTSARIFIQGAADTHRAISRRSWCSTGPISGVPTTTGGSSN
jgi:hypothetical protein